MHPIYLSSLLIFVAFACTSQQVLIEDSVDSKYQRLKSQYTQSNPRKSRSQVISKIVNSSTSPILPDPQGELTLQRAIKLTMARHPGLLAQLFEGSATEARALQAGRWFNPELSVEVEKFGGSDEFSGIQSLEVGVSLAQTFPLGGDLKQRQLFAWHEAQLVHWDSEALRLQVLSAVTRRYLAVLVAEKRLALTQQQLQFLRPTQAYFNANLQLHEVLSKVQWMTAQRQERQAQRQLQLAKKQLALMWGSKRVTFSRVVGSLDRVKPPPEIDQLSRIIKENPTVARWATEISARLVEFQLVQAEATPDLTVEVGYIYEYGAGVHYPTVSLSLPLTIFNRRQDDLLTAQLRALAAHESQREAELRIESLISQLHARVCNAYDEIKSVREVTLPTLLQLVERSRSSSSSNQEAVSAHQALYEVQMQQLDALVRYHQAVIELEMLIGVSLPKPET